MEDLRITRNVLDKPKDRFSLLKVWDEEGQLRDLEERINDREEALTWYEDGDIETKYSYIYIPSYDGYSLERKVRNGLWRKFYKGGRLASEEEYVNGKEHGLRREWHENGQLSSEGEYVNGMKQGLWLEFNPHGDVIFNGIYDKDQLIK